MELQKFDQEIPTKSFEKHLGNLISNTGYHVDLSDATRQIKVRLNVNLSDFLHLHTKTTPHICNSQCLALYESELWDLRDNELLKLNCEFRKYSRRLLNLNPSTQKTL